MSTKQLYEKTSEGMKEVSPLVAIEDIYSKLSDTPLEALVSLYNHVKCEWKGSVADTRRTVPLFLRRSGLFITYNNGTKYITEFFSAGTDQITTEGWVKDSNWTSVPDEDYISAGVKPGVGTIGYEQLSDNLKQLFREKVSVTNFPDDEDITSVDNMLKFKDREADVANFQSKGYVILRKNLRLINGVVKNVLTQDMIIQSNTIYEIRYDYDLHNTTINLPQNCILKFCGGSLNNGKLNGDKSIIEASPVRIFGKDIEISGTFVNSLNYAEWFDLDYEKTLLSFYGIDFVGNYLISKKISVDTGTNRIYLKFHPQSKITVNPTFIDDYLFDIKVSEVKDTTVRCDFNSVSGQGEIDLSERCGLISFTSSNKIGNLSAKGTDFSDLLNVHHAGKSIDNTVPTYDSNAVVNTAIIKVASESHFTNVNIYATRRYLASIPDCGILLQGTDHKLDRVTVVISTIGIYGIQGYTFIQDCHVWGAPHIAFYITGYHTINNTYGDWALCGFYLKGINYINITNYCVIGTTSTDSSVNDWFEGNKMCLIKCKNPYIVTGHISYFQTRARNLRVLSNDEGNLEIADSSFLTYENIFDKNYRTYIRKQFDNIEESDGNLYYYKISGKFYNHLLKLIFTLTSNISSCYLLTREATSKQNYVLEESYNTYLTGQPQISAYYNIGETDTMLISFYGRYSKFYVEYYNREKPLIVEKITKEDFDSNISTLNKMPILKEGMLFSDYPNMSHLPIYFKDIESVVSVVSGSKDKNIKTVGIPEYNNIKSLQIIPKSVCYSSSSNKIGVYQDNTKWMSDDFAPIDVLRRGWTSERPSLGTSNYGFEYYDKNLNKKILWNGTTWVNLDGSSLDVKKSGTTAERPANVEIGFIYKDTTLNKLILWEGIKWVNLDGSELAQ